MKHLLPVCIALLGMFCSCGKDLLLPYVDDVCTKMDDAILINYCYDNFDTDGDGKVSMQEAKAVKEIDVMENGVRSLKGVEYFSELVFLDVTLCPIETIDLSKNSKIETLRCAGSKVSSLDLTKCPVIKYIYCDGIKNLRSLEVAGCRHLWYIHAYRTSISHLNLSGCSECCDIVVYDTGISNLDVSKCAPCVICWVPENCNVKSRKDQDVSVYPYTEDY